jgi:hypothetical protein
VEGTALQRRRSTGRHRGGSRVSHKYPGRWDKTSRRLPIGYNKAIENWGSFCCRGVSDAECNLLVGSTNVGTR